MAATRADLEAQLAAFDRERADNVLHVAKLDAAITRLEGDLERAKPAEQEYLQQHQRLTDELGRLMTRHGLTVLDGGPNDVLVESVRAAVPREVKERIVELCRQRRQLEESRQEWLQRGGRTVAGATSDLQAATITRACLAARLGEGH